MNSDDMRRGVIPGLIAGYVFLAYAGTSMLDAIGAALGGTAMVGLIAHGVVSAALGAFYTGVFLRRHYLRNPSFNIIVGGYIYGLILWIVGGNIILPLLAGGDILTLSLNTSFYGHIIYGQMLASLVFLYYMALGLEQEYKMGRKQKGLPKRKQPE